MNIFFRSVLKAEFSNRSHGSATLVGGLKDIRHATEANPTAAPLEVSIRYSAAVRRRRRRIDFQVKEASGLCHAQPSILSTSLRHMHRKISSPAYFHTTRNDRFQAEAPKPFVMCSEPDVSIAPDLSPLSVRGIQTALHVDLWLLVYGPVHGTESAGHGTDTVFHGPRGLRVVVVLWVSL